MLLRVFSWRRLVAKGKTEAKTEGQNLQEAHKTWDWKKQPEEGEEIKRSYTKQAFQGQNEEDGTDKDAVDTWSKWLQNKPECERAAIPC